jgi:type I restriction enzyme S subunit
VYREHGVVPKSSRADNYNKTPDDLSRYLRVRPGDLVVNKMKAWSGSVGVSSHEGIVSGDYLVCGVRGDVDSRYLHHVLRSSWFVGEMRIRSRGIRPSQERLYWGDLADIAIPVLPLEEQRRVADFLDDQVARLDAASAETRATGRLVAARFQASVDALFDGSGPTIPLKALLQHFPQYGVLVPKLMDMGVPFIRIKDLSDLAGRDAASLVAIPPAQSLEYRRTVLKARDVLVGVVGSIDKAAVVPEQLAGANIARAVARLVPRPEVPSDVLLGWLSTTVYKLQVATVTDADTAQPTLNMSDLRNFRVALPARSLPALAASVQDVCEERRSLAERTNDLVRVLHERKQALITACVSGEFDVNTASLRARGAPL